MQFQLVFREDGNERTELRDIAGDEPKIGEQILENIGVVEIHGRDWIAQRQDDITGNARFVLRPALTD